MQLAFTKGNLFRAILLTGALSTYALAGPPLVCHPFDISGTQSLPWGDGWDRPDPNYDRAHLPADTLAILTPQAPVLVRMEKGACHMRLIEVSEPWAILEVNGETGYLRIH